MEELVVDKRTGFFVITISPATKYRSTPTFRTRT